MNSETSTTAAGSSTSRKVNETGNDRAQLGYTPRTNLDVFEESYMYLMGLRNTWWYDFQRVEVKELVKKLMYYVFTFEGTRT